VTARDCRRDFVMAHLRNRLVSTRVQACVTYSVWSPNAYS
jgi:hypothetical protein